MAINKVVYEGEALMDLTQDSVKPEHMVEGTTAHNAAGEPIVGVLPLVSVDSELSATSENPVQSKAIYNAIANQPKAADTITAGQFAGQVQAKADQQAPEISLLRNSSLLSAEATPTVNGEIFWTYN